MEVHINNLNLFTMIVIQKNNGNQKKSDIVVNTIIFVKIKIQMINQKNLKMKEFLITVKKIICLMRTNQ